MKELLFINDDIFKHSHSSSWYNHPSKFEWVRKQNSEHLVFTDYSVFEVNNYDSKKKYAWLLESPDITSSSYVFIKNNYDSFDKIFTFDEELLSISQKFKFTPIGGCWIEELERKIHKKTKLISYIMSSKKNTEGHKFRHEIDKKISNVDKFGFRKPIENKIEGLKDYMFSIVVENCRKNFYFTEKIIDCFITGTIPIYWGCPSINNFFDSNGYYTFDNIEELNSILTSINLETYYNKLETIQKNFILAKNYLVADNLIYNYIKNESN